MLNSSLQSLLKLRVLRSTINCINNNNNNTITYIIQVGSSSNSDLLTIMEQNSAHITEKYPEDSFPRLFWKQQLESLQLQNSKSMRWHPFMIR